MDDASASIRCNFSLEAEPSLLCCTPATDGTHEKERGIFPQQYNHERSINDASTNIVDPSMPRDTEYCQWMLCGALSVWLLRSRAVCLCVPPPLCVCISTPVLCPLLLSLLSVR